MKTITLSPSIESESEQDQKWIGKGAKPEDCELIYTNRESIKVLKSNGDVLCVLLKGVMDPVLTKKYYNCISKTGAIKKTDNRGMATGVQLENRVKKDGTISNTWKAPKGMEVESSIVGYFDRYPRTNYCRKTAWYQDHPQYVPVVEEYAEAVDFLYKKNAPLDYNEQRKIANKTSPDFIMGGSVFTTITINRNFKTHYHRDAGNLHVGLAAMSLIKTGKYSGGEVVFPNYRIAVKLEQFDLIIFDNIEIHGNLPIVGLGDYERITSVFFYRENMIYCGTAEQELERAKRNKGDQIIGPTTEDLNNGQFCKED